MRAAQLGGIHAPETQMRDKTPQHRCGQCYGPMGRSSIPCKNDPAVIIAARKQAKEQENA